MNEIMYYTSRWQTDGVGVLQLLDAFLSLATSPNLVDPKSLAYGQESARLAPAVKKAANVPETPTDAIKTFAQKNGEATTRPGGPRSSRLLLSPSETSNILNQCKVKGVFVTMAVRASVAATNAALALLNNRRTKENASPERSTSAFTPICPSNKVPHTQIYEWPVSDGLVESGPCIGFLDRQ